MMENKEKVTAILPIKEHSERVPGKNFRNFNGKPLYQWIIDALIASEWINEILLDTDCETMVKDFTKINPKIKIVLRPKELRGDFTSMNEIIAYDLSFSENEFFLQTHVTNPLLKTNTIDAAIERFCLESSEKKCDSLLSVTKIQSRCYLSDGTPLNHNPLHLQRSQDSAAIFEENSNLFIFKRAGFLRNGCSRVGKKPLFFVMDKIESTDIDDEDDFMLAEMLSLLMMQKTGKR